MKICDVVMNSIWYDPRVRKQIVEYLNHNVELSCVGYECPRYDEEKIKQIPCKTNVIHKHTQYLGKQRNIFKKITREKIKNQSVCDAIIAENPDVIHANDLDALIPAAMAQKVLGCALIYDSHEIYTKNNFLANKRLYAAYLKRKEKKLLKRIDLFVCVSHAAADYFAKTYKIKKPTVITNCSLKSEQYFSNEKNDGFEVLNHGQYYAGRGYDIMIEAAPLLQEYPEIRLALRGFGVLEDSLRARNQGLGNENVIFYPRVLTKELIPEASRAMVGVAITEGICINFEVSVSNKLFEYASAGLPVIMSDIPEHRYLNDKYQFGIVIPDNSPQTFAEAVIKLYTDKELYETCAQNAKKLSEEINWENEFAKLIEFEKTAFTRKADKNG